MKGVVYFVGLLLFIGSLTLVSSAAGDIFGSGGNAFEIEFVAIRDPGNPADTTGSPNPAGSVPYAYRVAKYEVSEQMINKANAQSAADGEPLEITIDARGPNKPATRVSWFEAAQFVNWLNISTGHVPAYKFDVSGDFQLWTPSDTGYNPANRFRNRHARYVLPSADEWYKAAFYDPATGGYFDFPTGSDIAPTPVASGTAPGTAVFDQPFEQGPADILLAGGPSPFGTVGQAGNVWEWEETDFLLMNDSDSYIRGIRGGGWYSHISGLRSTFRTLLGPGDAHIYMGFRVAAIPEPRTSLLVALCVWTSMLFRHATRKLRALES